ncbi:MAG: hypothetical protein WAL22_01615 [Solirubrobacteraceae bacterium]
MSVSSAGLMAGTHPGERSLPDRFRAYFWSDNVRRTQTLLGLLWLLDGGLQFQGFMYSHGFPQLIAGMAVGQPGWLHDSLIWSAKFANGDLAIWNTLFALTQVALGFGLLYRPLVKPALLASFGWVLVVWWFGEAFGMLFMDMAQPLTGAPGAVLLYGLVGLVAWPNGRRGGLLGIRGAKTMWAALWLGMAWLWLLAPNSSANATHDALTATDPGMGWLNSVQTHLASVAKGDGLVIALVLAAVSAAIGIAVAADWRPRTFLALAIVLNVVYWVVPQAFGGIFAGGATDPNAGLPFVLLAYAMFPIVSDPRTRPAPTTAVAQGS